MSGIRKELSKPDVNIGNVKILINEIKKNIYTIKRIDNKTLTPEEMMMKSKKSTAIPVSGGLPSIHNPKTRNI